MDETHFLSGSAKIKCRPSTMRYSDCHVIPCEITLAPSTENNDAHDGGASHTQGIAVWPTKLKTLPGSGSKIPVDLGSSTRDPQKPSEMLDKIDFGSDVVTFEQSFFRANPPSLIPLKLEGSVAELLLSSTDIASFNTGKLDQS
jgi:hypothetical protein